MFRTIPVAISRKVTSYCISNVLKRSLHSNLSKILCSPYASDKDLPTPTQFTSIDKLYSHDTDVLLEQLKKAKSTDRILELISMHIEVMNDRHMSACFNLIHDILKNDQRNGESIPDKAYILTSDEAFQSLCNRAMSRARFLEPEEVITIFKTLSTLNVRSNTYVMQAILKMLCHHVNNLNLRELIFLNFLLMKQKPTPLVKSLQLALPLVLQIQIDQQLDSENLNEVVSSLKMACKARLRQNTIEKVVATLQSKVSSFSSDHAMSIIFSLFSMDVPVDGYIHLLHAAFDIVCNDIDSINKKMLLDVTKACRKHGFYYRSFFLKLSKKAARERWELAECYDLLGSLHRLDFFSPELIDLLCERICGAPEIIANNPEYSILTISEHCTFADYQIYNVHNVVHVLQSITEKIQIMKRSHPHLYLKLVSCWAMLGNFNVDHLRNVLCEDYLFSAWALSRKHGRSSDFERYILALQWSLEIAESEFCVPDKLLKAVMQSREENRMKTSEYPLTKFLESGLGGAQFFHSGVLTRNGHFLDHVLAMRSGTYPVALGELPKHFVKTRAVSYIDDLQLPTDAKIVSIIVANKDQFCSDPCIFKGLLGVKFKNLLKLHYSPIIVNYEKWMELSEREKIPYLMREIKEATQIESSKLNIPSQ